jgi:septal ring factor EnvC (AmiA/AmiB activator)
MTEPSQELMHELLRRFHQRFDKLDLQDRELRVDNASIRNQLHSLQVDLHTMRDVLARIEDRLDQIEKRLELRDFQEMAQSPYNPGN